jgi:hypothetical protein
MAVHVDRFYLFMWAVTLVFSIGISVVLLSPLLRRPL